MKPSISVALCTYNGESFIAKQLESILQQTTQVDEIVVFDDCSTDATVQIVKEIQKNSAINIRLTQNEQNLGYIKNFEACVKACTGDLIFFSDQDDFWVPTKVEKILALFEKNPNWMAVFSNARVIDQHGHAKGFSSFDAIEFNAEQQDHWKKGGAFEILLRGYVVTGATLAIRKEVVDKVFPVPMIIEELIHDGWIAVYLAMFNQIGFTNECLIDYRTHEKQQVGFGQKAKKITLLDRLKRNRTEKLKRIAPKLENAKSLYLYLKELPETPAGPLGLIWNRKNHFEFRYQLPENRLLRIIPIIIHLAKGHYRINEVGKWWHTVLGDLFE